MSLALIVGPANAGKVASLLDRYVAALDREPFLVVPNRGEVERVERDLLRRVPVLLGGTVGTFEDLVERIVAAHPAARPVLSRAQRALLLSRVLSATRLSELAPSARFAGFVDTLGDAIADLEAQAVPPEELDGELARLVAAYRTERERLQVWDREQRARAAADVVGGDLEGWTGSPVFVYGFEDLGGEQWAMLEALSARADVCVSLPYQPARPAFESLERTANDLAALAGPAVEELSAQGWYHSASLEFLERMLFEDREEEPPALDGSIRFLESAGARGVFELVGEEILELLRGGRAPEEIGVVVPSVDRVRAPLETAFGALGIPHALEAPVRLSRTPFGHALLGLLRFAWLDGGRGTLFGFLRSPYSGLPRSRADFVEGRLRGRGISSSPSVEEECVRLLGHPLVALDALRSAESGLEAVRALARGMLQAAWDGGRPRTDEVLELDLRAEEALGDALDEIEAWSTLGGHAGPEEIVALLERASFMRRSEGVGRIAVLDLLRARTRRFEVLFVLGLEEGVLPRRVGEASLLSDDVRRALDFSAPVGRRLLRPDQVSRDRYLFYTACTRAWRRLYLVREAATEDGRPLEASPFWEEVRSRFDRTQVELWTSRRPLSAAVRELHDAPTERERLRTVAALAAADESDARALAATLGWTRQVERALAAFSRPTRLVNQSVLEQLREVSRYSVTELEQFGDCSSMWLIERVVQPRDIDAKVDPRLRGGVAHQALYRFYAGLPKRFGSDSVDPERVEEAIEYLHECLADAIASQVRIVVPEPELLELEGTLSRDLERFVRQDAARELTLVPRRFEVSFGSERAAPELQRGLDLGSFTVSGKIDRIDVDPFSARGIVQDYKSGVAFSASRIEADGRLQIPLYILALRDLVGMEPLGGLYQSLSGEGEARGLLRQEARVDLPGFAARDYLDEETFWAQMDGATERARTAVSRMRDGDARHDPRWKDGCPSWCELWPICRVPRA